MAGVLTREGLILVLCDCATGSLIRASVTSDATTTTTAKTTS